MRFDPDGAWRILVTIEWAGDNARVMATVSDQYAHAEVTCTHGADYLVKSPLNADLAVATVLHSVTFRRCVRLSVAALLAIATLLGQNPKQIQTGL